MQAKVWVGRRDFARFYYMAAMAERACMFENKFVSRCSKTRGFRTVINVRLHHLLDASKDGYGAVWYLRIVNSKGVPHCSFVPGKTCVTPLKVVSIPHLELAAVVVAVKLSCLIRNELEYLKHDKIYGTDSTEVLQDICIELRRFYTFVPNRVTMIKARSTPHQ